MPVILTTVQRQRHNNKRKLFCDRYCTCTRRYLGTSLTCTRRYLGTSLKSTRRSVPWTVSVSDTPEVPPSQRAHSKRESPGHRWSAHSCSPQSPSWPGSHQKGPPLGCPSQRGWGPGHRISPEEAELFKFAHDRPMGMEEQLSQWKRVGRGGGGGGGGRGGGI